MFTLKWYHFLCVCYGIGSLCAGVLGTKYKSICVLVFLVIISFVLSSCIVCMVLNASNVPVLGVMNVCTLIGLLLTRVCL